MAVPAWPFGKPVADQLGLMARRIVHDDVNVEVSWHTLLDGVEEPAESCARCRDMHLPITVPAFTSNAANSEVVPCRL